MSLLASGGRRDSLSRALLLKPGRFLLLKAGAGFFGSKPFTAFKLAKGQLDLLMDDLAVIGQERFFFVKHLNGPLHEVVNGLISAALHILLDQGLQLGLEVNGHKGKISFGVVTVNRNRSRGLLAAGRRGAHKRRICDFHLGLAIDPRKPLVVVLVL
jgi:hypothetical protein